MRSKIHKLRRCSEIYGNRCLNLCWCLETSKQENGESPLFFFVQMFFVSKRSNGPPAMSTPDRVDMAGGPFERLEAKKRSGARKLRFPIVVLLKPELLVPRMCGLASLYFLSLIRHTNTFACATFVCLGRSCARLHIKS